MIVAEGDLVALRTALDSLAKRLGPDDDRSHKQRMADSMNELVHQAMSEGRLPRRNGVRPHVNVTTTLEGLKNEFGAPPADLELSLPISTRTLERITCGLHHLAGAAGRLDGDRCRTGDAGGLGADAARLAHAGSRLPVAGL